MRLAPKKSVKLMAINLTLIALNVDVRYGGDFREFIGDS